MLYRYELRASATAFDWDLLIFPPAPQSQGVFNCQMDAKEHGGMFASLPEYHKLERRFRAAAAQVFIQHGVEPAEARRRAAHRRVDRCRLPGMVLLAAPVEAGLWVVVVCSWVSVHSKGSMHERHSHVASTISGVFYCRVPPGSGAIRFHDPRGQHKIMESTMAPLPKYGDAADVLLGPAGGVPPFRGSYAVPVSEGMMVLFPSWLLHQVRPHGSTQCARPPLMPIHRNLCHARG
jgi:hypothetical protein